MIDRVIKLKEHQVKLLREIKNNSYLQSKEYYVTKVDNYNYQLVRTEGNELMKVDNLPRINSFLRLRGILDSVVFDCGINLKL